MYSEKVQKLLVAIPKQAIDEGIRPDSSPIREGRAFVYGMDALLTLMSLGYSVKGKAKTSAFWLANASGFPVDVNVRTALVETIIRNGLGQFREIGFPYNETKLTRMGEKEARSAFAKHGWKEVIPAIELNKRKEENIDYVKVEAKPDVTNAAVLDHAIGPFADGYVLQVVFDNLESLLKAARGMGIVKPKIEAVAPIVNTMVPQPAKPKELITHDEKKELVKSDTHCANCGVQVSGKGKMPKSGFRFCSDPKCRNRALYELHKARKAK